MSLAQTWRDGNLKAWIPPFEGARIAVRSPFTAQSIDSELTHTLALYSSVHKLLKAYRMAPARESNNLVKRVQRIVRTHRDTEHLAHRFSKTLTIGERALPLRVDFLGQHYVCYMMKVTESAHYADQLAERALGRVQELQAIRRHIARRDHYLHGLFDDERPEQFELLMVGDPNHPVQGQVMGRIEWAADKQEVRVRATPSAESAARHVVEQERRAA